MANGSNIEFKLTGPSVEEFRCLSAVSLSCHSSPEVSAVGMEIRWFKGTDCVCLYNDGQVIKGRGYEGRVSLFTDELERGNVSLQITDCGQSDTGHYLCQVTSGDTTEEWTVEVLVLWLREYVSVQQSYRKWTEKERSKMEESALLIKFSRDAKLYQDKEKLFIQAAHLMEKDTQTQKKKQNKMMKQKMLEEENICLREKNEKLIQEKDRLLSELKDELKHTTKTLEESHRLEMEEIEKRLVEKEQKIKTLLKEKDTDLQEHLENMNKKDALLKEINERFDCVSNQLQERDTQLEKTSKQLSERETLVEKKVKEVETLGKELQEMMILLEQQKTELTHQQNELEKKELEKDKLIQEKDRLLSEVKDELKQTTKTLEENHKKQLEEMEKRLVEKDQVFKTQLTHQQNELEKKEQQLQLKEQKISDLKTRSETLKMVISSQTMDVADKIQQLEELKNIITERETRLLEKDKQVQEKDRLLSELKDELKQTTKTLEDNHRLQMEEMEKRLVEKEQEFKALLKEKDLILQDNLGNINKKDTLLKEINEILERVSSQLQERDTQLEKTSKQLRRTEKKVKEVETLGKELQEMMILLEQQKTELTHKQNELEKKEQQLQLKEQNISDTQTENETLKTVISSQKMVRLVLVGRSESEKSSALNLLLCREQIQAGASPVRQQSESRQEEVAGRPVTVVDTPDWFCPGLSLEEVRQDVRLCLSLSDPGPHAFLLLVPVKPSAGQERGMLEKMEELFGERCWRNTIILFTVTDEDPEKNIEEFVQSGEQELRRLVEKCENRFHRLNIQSGDHSQISELLEKIDKMVEGNEEKFYSSEIYLETESHVREIQEEIREMMEGECREKLRRCVNRSLIKLERVQQVVKNDTGTKELERENQEMNEAQLEIERHKEETEKEERHKQEMEEIRQMYGEGRMEAERNLMKRLRPKLRNRMWKLLTKKQNELETVKQKVRKKGGDILAYLGYQLEGHGDLIISSLQ